MAFYFIMKKTEEIAMKYIPFGQEKRELSEIVLGMMRISDKSVREVEELVETALPSVSRPY